MSPVGRVLHHAKQGIEGVAVSRAARWAVDAVIVLFLAGLVLLIARNEAPTEPKARPAETFSHVDLVVDDRGVHATPKTVPAGHVEVTMTDQRSDKTHPVSVRSVPPPLGMTVGTKLIALRIAGRGYALTADVNGEPLPEGDSVSVVVPELAAPQEPAHQVTVEVAEDGITTPAREARRGQPLLLTTENEPPMAQPWTTVVPGKTEIVVRNRTGAEQQCSVGDESVSVDETATLITQLGGDDGFATLTCAGGGRSFSFGLWFS